jgi:cytochrome c oxidase cbb3-type subunit I/II
MPRYTHLLEKPLDLGELTASLKAMQTLGVEYTNAEIENASDTARAQAKLIADTVVVEGGPTGVEERKVVALIAYLMRLGTDINKPTAPIVEVPTAAATGGTP